MKHSRLNAEYPAADGTAISNPAVSNLDGRCFCGCEKSREAEKSSGLSRPFASNPVPLF
jgi:hypothetical protein